MSLLVELGPVITMISHKEQQSERERLQNIGRSIATVNFAKSQLIMAAPKIIIVLFLLSWFTYSKVFHVDTFTTKYNCTMVDSFSDETAWLCDDGITYWLKEGDDRL